MLLSFLVESITAATIAFIVERIIRKTLNYIYNNNHIIEYHTQRTQDEIVLVNNKLLKFLIIINRSDDVPKIAPIKLNEYEVKQSKYNVASKLPMRSIILGPSGSGKSILLQNFILDIFI